MKEKRKRKGITRESLGLEKLPHDKELFDCPSCGYLYPISMDTCPICGASCKGAKITTQRDIPAKICYLKPTPIVDEADTIFPITGRGMMPYVDDGQSVYIKYTDHLDIGDIGAVYLEDGRAVIRYLSEDGLCSLSPEWESFHVDPHTRFEVIGKVVGVVQDKDFADPDDIALYQEKFASEIKEYMETHDLVD